MTQVYRILYCSRNSLQGSIEDQKNEVHNILDKSRKNNAKVSITGALLFNAGCFAQVLEGPLQQVEQTFERIQRDMRHEDVSVLESGYVPNREFPEWSMAFAGSATEESSALAVFRTPNTSVNTSAAAAEINALLRTLVVQGEEEVQLK